MGSFPPVQSVQRALDILVELNRNRVTTVRQLHETTGLPKPTIVRLLQTLVAAGYVSNDPRHGGYQVTSGVSSLSAGFHGDPLVVEAGRASVADLTKRLTWPATIAIFDNNTMIVRFSTIADSPNSPFHVTVNMRLSLASHALGLAYLAFCPPSEQSMLIDMLEQSDAPLQQLPCTRAMFARRIATIRKQGFAERDPTMQPVSSNTIAVPILARDRVLGTVGMTYFRSAYSRNEAIRYFVGDLKSVATVISRNTLALMPE